VAPFILKALAYSVKLGAVAFVLVVPLGVAGGVWAALHAGRAVDRIITILGLSATVVPEFVTGIVLIMVFGIWLKILPISADWPMGAGPLTQLHHLILPSMPLVLVLFGYLARMARAGTVAVLAAEYTRTAILKGLPRRQVIWRHVLRNALIPTITVIATQVGYLIGGLVVIEVLFRYPGIGSLIFTAAKSRDFPMLEAGVLVIGAIYALAMLAADMLTAFLDPRIRFGRE
jgi:peptide/nickel transport system permease protein